jgi:hypothetical protein
MLQLPVGISPEALPSAISADPPGKAMDAPSDTGPDWPSVMPLEIVPGYAPFWSAAVVPLVSFRRQYDTGLSLRTVAL